MIDEKAWKTWREFNQITGSKKIVFFGYSHDWIRKTIVKSDMTMIGVVDNSENFIGQIDRYTNNDIKKPSDGLDHCQAKYDKDFYIVITTLSFESVYEELIDLGFIPGDDFCITPALNSVRIVSDMNSINKKVLVSSPDHSIYSKGQSVGGLYIYDTSNYKYEKIFDGTFRQLDEDRDFYYALDERRGVFRITKGFQVFDLLCEIEKGERPHGMCLHRNGFAVSATAQDKIKFFEEEGKSIFNHEFGDIDESNINHYWINDLTTYAGEIYLSVFSISGSQQQGIYDGAVVRWNDRKEIIKNLFMPHSVRFFNNQLHVLDSMNGLLYRGDKEILGEFPGFTRGLDYNNGYYYVGQSENRYFDMLRNRKMIGMNAGFYIFDEQTKASRFYSMPTLHQIHDLLVID